MRFPEDLKYTSEHEWARIEADTATVGVTDYAQQSLGDVVYVELPETGMNLEKGKEFGVVESVKAASDIYSPLSGEVVEANEQLQDHPEYINQSPYEKGWIIKIKIEDPSEAEELMDAKAYQDYLANQEENQ
ncbi:MAG: glycine cleavage system protein GcvH [Spirochaetota bacterium]